MQRFFFFKLILRFQDVFLFADVIYFKLFVLLFILSIQNGDLQLIK